MSHKVVRLFFVLTLVIGLVAVPAPQPVRAAGLWYVSTTGDDTNDCMTSTTPCATINGALNNPGFAYGDTILVAVGTYTGAGNEVVLINKSVTLSGGWDASFATQSGTSTIDGQAARRGITVNNGTTVTIERFVIQNGSVISAAGIYNGGILTLNESAVFSNTTVVSGSSIGGAGGISNAEGAVLTLNATTVSGNHADAGGGGISNAGTMTINNSTISDNVAGSSWTGGGIDNFGSANLVINNSTIYNNTSGNGGGIYTWPNLAVVLSNSILAGNTSNGPIFGPDCQGPINSSGYNLIGDDSGCTFSAMTGDLVGTSASLINPQLTPLQDNGGPTLTHALLASSPAIDAGNPAGCTDQNGNPLTTDQRGVARPQGTRCDIGAYEGRRTGLSVAGGNNQRTAPTFAFLRPLQATVFDDQGNPVSGTTVDFTAPVSGPSGTFADTGTNTASVNTDASGVATTSIFTANDQAGTYSVTVTASGLADSVIFTLTNAPAWYVAPTGADTSDCLSQNTACATINGALNNSGFVPGDTILIAIGTYTGTGGEVVLLNKNATLSGGWDDTFTTQSGMSTIDGQKMQRGLTVISGVTISAENLLVQNGSYTSTPFYGAGIANNGTLIMNHSAVNGNNATDGGGIYNTGNLTMTNSAVTDNIATYGGGINNGGGQVILNNSTVSGNTGSWGGGGIYNQSSGIVSLNSSTVSNNKADGGIYGDGGGINNWSGSITLQNSILASNSATHFSPDCNGFISLGYNLIQDASGCAFSSSTGDLTFTSAMLGPLVGSPAYSPLSSTSPAVNSGNPAGCTDQNGNLLITDQRGAARVGTCDIGAYEYTIPGPAASLSIVSGNGQSTGTTMAFPNPLQAAALDNQGSPVNGVAIDFTAPGSGASGTFADTGTITTSANTDNGGVATTPAFTANDQVGTYTVSASAPGLESVNFTLEQLVRPSNDNFVNAKAITSLPFGAAMDITTATNEANEPQNCYSMPNTVWYSFTPTETISVQVDAQGSAISSNLNVYHSTGTGISNLQFLQCASYGNSYTFLAEAGQTYYIQAGSANGEFGSIQINLKQVFPPSNDNFANAKSITALPFNSSVDSTQATTESSEPQYCYYANKTAWYSYTPTANTLVSFDMAGSSFSDTIFTVYQSNGSGIGGLSFIQCAYYGNSTTFIAQAGTTYYIQAGSINADGGDLHLNLQEIPRPANDDFVSAKVISALPFNDSVDNTQSTTESGEPQYCYYSPKTVWYSFTPTSNALVKADMTGSNFSDTIFNIYQSNGSGINGLSFIQCGYYGNSVTFSVQAGVTYYIQAGSMYSGGDLHLNLQELQRPTNDDFASAKVIPALPFDETSDMSTATIEAGEPTPSCAFYGLGSRSVWYAFTPATSGTISANLPYLSFSPVYAAYTGSSLTSLSQLGCAYAGNRLTFHADAGTTYYFQVSNLYPWEQAGSIQFLLDVAPPPAAGMFFFPSDPSTFDNIQFYDQSYDPAGLGIQSYTWNFGDGTTSTNPYPTHQYAKVGDYTVQHSVTTTDGRTASTSQVVQVRMHDVTLTKVDAPEEAKSGKAQTITVSVKNDASSNTESVTVNLYKSVAGGGFQWIGAVTLPVSKGKKATQFSFQYTFTGADAQIGKVIFHAVATIEGGRDAFPQDNEGFSALTTVKKGKVSYP